MTGKPLARCASLVAMLRQGKKTMMSGSRSVLILAFAAFGATASAARAQDCVICAKSVVINSDLAQCFLDKYSKLGDAAGAAVAIDLTQCAKERSIVQALPTPTMAVDEPDTKFLLSRKQVECLRQQIVDGDLELDPSARIDLASCQ
jgi:hypothetical protein